jgi:acetyl esterase/lipase
MVPRLLGLLALLGAALLVVPPLSWPMWMARFAAIEGCLLPALLGGISLALTRGRWRIPGALALLGGLTPFLLAVPVYLREDVPFSASAWLLGDKPALTPERDVRIGGILADVWTTRTDRGPAVVVVHGGSWRAGDKGEVPHVSAALAEAGYTVFDIRYRLEPFPAGFEDLRCAIVGVAADPRVDPARIALLGRSAGGELVLLAAYADLPSPCPKVPVAAVVGLYAPTDLAWAHEHPYVPDVVDGTAALEQYLGGTPRTAADRYTAATPQTWVNASSPPTLLIHGEAERCVRPENAERLESALRAVGAPVERLMVPLADHGFDVRPGGLGEQLARARILRFLHDKL